LANKKLVDEDSECPPVYCCAVAWQCVSRLHSVNRSMCRPYLYF